MVIKEELGNGLVRHYSDANKTLLQVETGIEYYDAIDVEPCQYTYEETENEIENDREPADEVTDEATEEDYIKALESLGVSFDEETETI